MRMKFNFEPQEVKDALVNKLVESDRINVTSSQFEITLTKDGVVLKTKESKTKNKRSTKKKPSRERQREP